MTDIPDRVWRSEFVTQTTGVTTFLLPELGRLTDKDALKDRGPSECCIAAAMAYGVPLWTGSINKDVVEEVWDVQREFGIDAAGFAPFWEQADFVCSHPDIRISSWRRPGKRLIVVANFGAEEAQVTLTPTSPEPGVTFAPAWQADSLTVADGEAHLTVPGYRGALLFAEGMAKPD